MSPNENHAYYDFLAEKAKSAVRRGRKATGLYICGRQPGCLEWQSGFVIFGGSDHEQANFSDEDFYKAAHLFLS